MRKVFALAFLSAIVIASAGCSQPDFDKYTSPAEDFTIKFPGEPTVKETTENNNGVTINTTEYAVDPKYGFIGNRYTVIVSVIVPPTGVDSIPFDMDAILQGAREGVEKEGGTVNSQKAITHGDLDGWQFECSAPNTDSTIWFFMKGLKFYVIEIARKSGKDVSEERKEFLESFELL